MKLGLIGNTRQTLKGLQRTLELGHEVKYVFGLPEHKCKNKVNSVSLSEICTVNNINLDTSNNWNNLLEQNLDLVIGLGDSRIVPEKILNKHKVIGNHGATLPYVQGGASLVWGRMLNSGVWGVSIMELDAAIDAGKILVTKEFSYEKDCTMESFVDKADDLTIDCLVDYLADDYKARDNSKWNIKIAKHTDSEFAVETLRTTLEKKQCIYLPPRTPEDSEIKSAWGYDFKNSFKIANNNPYPRWV